MTIRGGIATLSLVVYDVGADASTEIPSNSTYGTAQVVARDMHGRLLARLDDPFCETRTWVFAADGSVRLLPGRQPFVR